MSVLSTLLSGIQARRIINKIVWEGKDVTADISNEVISINSTDGINSFDTVDITIDDRTDKWIGAWKPKKGETIVFTYILHAWELLPIPFTYNYGKFYIDGITFNGPPATMTVKCISISPESTFMDEKKNKVWDNVKLKKVAEDIAKANNLELIWESDFDRDYKRIEQKLESDYNFIVRICKEPGINVKVYNDKLILFEEEKYEKKDPVLTITKKEMTRYSFTDDDSHQYSKCVISYYDSASGKKLEAKFTAKERKGEKTTNKRTLYINAEKSPPGGNKTQKNQYLLELAKKELKNANKKRVKGYFTYLMKLKQIVVGDVIQTPSFMQYAGKYLVETVKTNYEDGMQTIDVRKIETEEETETQADAE